MIRRLDYWARFGLLLWVRLYQRTISCLLPPSCRFEPSCSHYALEVLQRWPLGRGLGLILKRLARCQPFCRSGFDPVPEFSGCSGHRILEVKSLRGAMSAARGARGPRGEVVAGCLERDTPEIHG